MSIIVKNISKTYQTIEKGKFYAIKDISINFKDTGFYTIVGHSGSGKSTLLNIIGKLEKQSEGTIEYSYEKNINFHKYYISFVFQENNLLEEFSLIENLKLVSSKDPKILLEKVQLFDKINVPVNKLSGGEKQRLAIVRAILKDCQVIILDEPTLNLDKKNISLIINILKEISKTKLIIISTHDDDVIKFSDFIIRLKNGVIVENIDLEDSNFIFNGYDEETVINVYKIINTKKKYNKCYCTVNDNIIDVYNQSTLKNIFSNLKSDKNIINLRFIKEEKKEEKNYYTTEKIKNFNFALKYSFLLLKRNFISTFFIILSLIITILLTIIMFNITFSNSTDIINNSRKNYDYTIYPISKDRYSFLRQSRFKEYNGKNHYNNLKNIISEKNIGISLSIEIKNEPLINTNLGDIFSLVLFNKDNYNSILKTYKYNKNDIFVSDYVNEIYLKSKNERNLNIKVSNFLNINLNNISNNIIKTNYEDLDFNTFEDNINISKYILKFKNKISLVYMSEELFDEYIKNKSLYLQSSNFFKKNTKDLLNTYQYYKKYDNEEITYGNNISKYNEIIVSENFLLSNNLKKEDVIDKTYNIIDFNKLISKDEYDFIFNLGNYSKNFIIKGITNNTSSDVFIKEEIFNKIVKDYKYFISDSIFLLSNNNFKVSLKNLHCKQYNINYLFEKVYSFEIIKNSLLKKVAIVACILLSIISFSLLISISILLINSKRKQIAILKSLGKTNKDIFLIFLYNNLIYLLFSIPFGFAFAISSFKILDYLLINLILKVEYNILLNYFSSFIYSSIICIIFSIFTAYIPFLKINKIDIAEIKEY